MYFRASRYGMAYDNLSGSLKKFGNLPPSTEEAASESDNAEIFGHDTYISERFDIIKQTEYGRICITILAPKKEISYD